MYKPKIFCIIILSLVTLLFFTAQRKKNKVNNTYAWLLIISLIHEWLDLASVYTIHNMDVVPGFVNRFVHSLFFTSLLTVFFIIHRYIRTLIETEMDIPLNDKIISRISLVVLITTGALSAILPIEYVQTAKGNYSGGPAVYALYSGIVYFISMLIAMLIRYRKNLPSRKMNPILIAIACELLVSVYQCIFPTSLVSTLGITTLSLGFYLTVENPDTLLIEKLKETTERADAANNAKTSFLANMSHEIRTPINTVLGMIEVIIRESKQRDIRGYALDVKSAAKSLLEIINDILDINKIEAGKLTLLSVDYHLASVINDIYNMINFKAMKKQLKFNIEASDDLPSTLFGDDIRLKQILINLLNNAVKYTNSGSVTLEIKRLNNNKIFFSVKDTGIGIKEEDLSKLFVAFERIEENRNRNIEGTGLGMSITVKLLDLFGSKLEVKSVYGEGSEFSFVLNQKIIDDTPIIVDDLCKARTYSEKEYHAAFEAPDAKILVVDDNQMNRKVFSELIKDTKINVTEASGGKEALKKSEKCKFDLIFMDHMMPGMDGIETLQALKNQADNPNKKTPVVVLTANAITGVRQQYIKAGFDDFLSKPIDPDKLETMIYSMLDSSLIHELDKRNDTDDYSELHVDFPIVEGLDWNYAMLHFRNDKALLDAVKMFFYMIKSDSDELNEYYSSIDTQDGLDNYRIKVHSMKNSAMMIGIVQLAGMAMALEGAARAKDLDTITAVHDIFIGKWLKYSDLFSEFISEANPVKIAIEHNREIAQIFEDIRAAASDMDVDALDALSMKLDEFRFEGEFNEKIQQVRKDIFNFDIEKLMKLEPINFQQ